MQGLGFLSKKSFHTANIANQEKVWIAEQKQKTEDAKTLELAQQIQQEREREELDRIAGKETKGDRGINWMYDEGGRAALEKEREEQQKEDFLLGKTFAPEESFVKQAPVATDGVDAIVSHISQTQNQEEVRLIGDPHGDHPSSMLAGEAQDRNEEFRLRYEDPMYAVL